MEKTYLQVLNCQVGLSTKDFFETFLSDNATQSLGKFYESQKAKNVTTTAWNEPQTADEKVYEGETVHKIRVIDAEFKVDSTFVKSAPTMKTYRIVQNSSTYIRISCINRTRDIPYADTFDVEDIFTIHSLKPESKCCIVQIGIGFNWHKSTMMKSMIKGQAETAAKQMNVNYAAILKQFSFVEQKKPQKAQPKREASAGPAEVDDYTTEKALKAILTKEKI